MPTSLDKTRMCLQEVLTIGTVNETVSVKGVISLTNNINTYPNITSQRLKRQNTKYWMIASVCEKPGSTKATCHWHGLAPATKANLNTPAFPKMLQPKPQAASLGQHASRRKYMLVGQNARTTVKGPSKKPPEGTCGGFMG